MDYFRNYKSITVDEKAKSLTFFCGDIIKRVESDIIKELKNVAFKEGVNVRLNLHDSPESAFHDMIIFQWKNTYVRPHKHINKAETCHIIEGKHTFVVLDDCGKSLDIFDMEVPNAPIFRVERECYHFSVPTSKFVLFHESKIGPFEGKDDSVFPSWAPESNQGHEAQIYIDKLLKSKL